MPKTISECYTHIVFSTKNRRPVIEPSIQKSLYSYIAGICSNQKCHLITIGGIQDHIHLLCQISNTSSVSSLVKHVKVNSTLWLKSKGSEYRAFQWQRGYASFSVSKKDLKKLTTYIENQQAHHAKVTFQTEYLRFLQEYSVDYVEPYIWD
ncbi:MAG: IS200/IS605 family transposase [Flavobacteriales bacterium]|nr:IS200/IS605 family transposase [Flavobacteriales bacterium]